MCNIYVVYMYNIWIVCSIRLYILHTQCIYSNRAATGLQQIVYDYTYRIHSVYSNRAATGLQQIVYDYTYCIHSIYSMKEEA